MEGDNIVTRVKKIEYEFYSDKMPTGVNYMRNGNKPSVHNGTVKIKQYRLLAEEIEEPQEVYIDRLRTLYRTESLWSNKVTLNIYALKNYGLDLKKEIENENT